MATTKQASSRLSNKKDLGWKCSHPFDESNLNILVT